MALLTRVREAQGGFVAIGDLGADSSSLMSELDELEAFGFQIERHPYHGIAYRGPSARLCPDQIEWNIGTRVIGRRIAVWNRVGSTNDLAARASTSRANEGLAILAEEQTSGRGSRGRVWSAPAGSSILMSILLFPRRPLDDPGWLTALGAVAVSEVLSEEFDLDARIKWPNDVRVGEAKVSGILVERASGTVLGIGLNVNTVAEAFPEELRDSATSLRRLLCRPVDRSELARSILKRLDRHYTRAIDDGPEALGIAYGLRSEHSGRRVEVWTKDGAIVGRLETIGLLDGLTLSPSENPPRKIVLRDVLKIVNIT
ncbi:biotin--[acetyl-CoA-carboxylase] ligase [Tundrisphaera lichenicola]|uniref:biotin--[acetyl-CoA-carboxylase] ligase n=1 Tax=Tundrisphaera lichenicola TaxID=2029860 RepID=UPI003EBC72BA